MIRLTPSRLNLKINISSETELLWCLCANAIGCGILFSDNGFTAETSSETIDRLIRFFKKLGLSVEGTGLPAVRLNASAYGNLFSAAELCGFLHYAVVILSLTRGRSEIRDLKLLSQKERDSIFRLLGLLKSLGADASVSPSAGGSIKIKGRQVFGGGRLSAGGDKAVFSALLLASLRCEGGLSLTGISGAENIFPLADSRMLAMLGVTKAELSSENKNIILIGMSGAGKTHIGRKLSEQLNMPFFDTDEEFEAEETKKISDVFANEGEEYFRKRESEIINRLALKNGIIISTGGGAVLKRENLDVLKESGIIIYIERDISVIAKTVAGDDRPLFKNGKKAIYELFEKREAMYLSSADFNVKNNDVPEKAVSEIMDIYEKITKRGF